MLNTRLDVARTVAAELIMLEKHVDAALITQGKLQAVVIEGRRRARLPLDAGQAGIENVAEAAKILIEARRLIHAAHLDFRAVQDAMKVGPVSFGDYGDTPMSYDPSDDAAVERRVVAIADAA